MMTTEEPELQKSKNPKNRQNKGLQNFGRYSGLAFQMIGIILIPTLGGIQIDKHTGWETPVFTVILSLFGVFASIYIAVKGFTK